MSPFAHRPADRRRLAPVGPDVGIDVGVALLGQGARRRLHRDVLRASGTGFGIHCHELGHYVFDVCLAPRGITTTAVREQGAEPILVPSAYWKTHGEEYILAGNDHGLEDEWCAEMLRLFVTNPDLLSLLRPRTYRALLGLGRKPIERRGWREVLAGAPPKVWALTERRIAEAKRA
jgi:hypothetical protein